MRSIVDDKEVVSQADSLGEAPLALRFRSPYGQFDGALQDVQDSKTSQDVQLLIVTSSSTLRLACRDVFLAFCRFHCAFRAGRNIFQQKVTNVARL